MKLMIRNVISGKMSFFNFSLTLRRRNTPYGDLVVPPNNDVTDPLILLKMKNAGKFSPLLLNFLSFGENRI